MPTTPRKLMHASLVFDAALTYDLMTLIDGKSFDVVIRPVKHGGVDPETGTPKAMPSAQAFVLGLMAKHAQFDNKTLYAAATEIGMAKATAYGGLMQLKEKGVVKSIGTGLWKVTGKAPPPSMRGKHLRHNLKPALAAKRKKKSSRQPSAPNGTRTSDKIAAALRRHNGEVTIKTLKAALAANGAKAQNISPTITDMLKRGEIVRVSPGVYRAPDAVAASTH